MEKLFACENFTISTFEEGKKVLFDNTNFIIPEPGIYTLEGKNRSGKSVFIRYIMGALPTGVFNEKSPTLIISGKTESVKNVRKAIKCGLVAVFQDDNLIPTMTVREQLLLRHYTNPPVQTWIKNMWHLGLRLFYGLTFLDFIAELFHNFKNLLQKIDQNDRNANPESDIEKKILKYFEKFKLSEEYLDSYPRELSGGTKDTIKIINALLTPNIKVLFLDEALNHIDEERRFNIIEKIKSWREEETHSNVAIVVVSHDNDERLQWQPRDRYFVDDEKKIASLDYSGYNNLDSGRFFKNDFFPVYHSISAAKSFFNKNDGPYVSLVEKRVLSHSSTKALFKLIPDNKVVELVICENGKNISKYVEYIEKVAQYFPKSKGTLIIIGGGVTINFGAFIAATLHRGVLKHIIVPTTVMAIADVAVGSKASLNLNRTNESGKILPSGIMKHVIGAYKNPACIIMDPGYIEELPKPEVINGLSECLKHGLLQDPSLYNDVMGLLNAEKLDTLKCYNIAVRTQQLKSLVLTNDPFEESYGRILLFGHLHAHSLERVENLEMSHGLAVYWGIALDLKIAGIGTLFEDYIRMIKTNSYLCEQFKAIASKISECDVESLRLFYNTDTKSQHSKEKDSFTIIAASKVGCYANVGMKLEEKVIEWNELKDRLYELKSHFLI